ncbi:hypothetical protein Val02_25250 [Virgisporangium aliadipatigenens]|uniref:Asp23/Gls24 family envelope stress response protein n=1 Tax=Virgisporangium aliadipatigenens TaxID=741659 RepID=A0A8J4DPL9_9ACTN|nr:Asp23/Gls24 family envelope stress response protein [Virgisporangium aliadipatigenens]GIJ45639.1 hypothetical protein Val02_25250 [Virgisporangium aliadipatigenens]
MTEVYNASGQYQYGGGGPVPPPIMVPPQATPVPVTPAAPVSPPFAPAVEYQQPAEEPQDETAVAEEPRSGGLSLAKKPSAEEAEAAPAPVSAPPSVTSTSGRVAVQVVDRLGTNARRGTTTIPPAVIEKIVTTSTRDVPGVYAFSGAIFSEEGERAVTIELDGSKAVVEIRIVVEYGFAVYSVTDKIRTKVIGALENLFALDVTAVNIAIDDIHISDAEASE